MNYQLVFDNSDSYRISAYLIDLCQKNDLWDDVGWPIKNFTIPFPDQ